MLQVSNLNAWYGASHVLQDISIEVAKGEIVCLIGRNGAGKTTTLKSIMGLMDKKREVELIANIASIFPRLAERLDQEAVTMSGGEQQMLAIARAMIAKPDLIMLDEPSEGIMPVLVDEMFELFRAMKAQGTTVLLVEQNVE